MKDAYTSMVQTLGPLCLYDFENTNISNELKAYACVLNELNGTLMTMLDECFIDSASTYGLSQRELVIGAQRDDLSIEKRREMLKLRNSISSNSFTVSKINESLRSFGLSCDVYEYPSLYTVVVDARGSYTASEKAWIRSQVNKIMPAHLTVNVVFNGISWENSDSNNNTFSYIDSTNYTWQQIDDYE